MAANGWGKSSQERTQKSKRPRLPKQAGKSLLSALSQFLELAMRHPVVTGLSVLSAIVCLVWAYLAFQSSISIEADPTNGVGNPFDQNFDYKNQGLLPIYKTTFHSEMVNVNHGALPGEICISANPVERVLSGDKKSFRLGYLEAPQNLVRSGEVDVSIRYTPFLWFSEIETTQRFSLFQNTNGTFNWLAEGQPKKNFIPVEDASALPKGQSIIIFPPDGQPYLTNTPP